MLDDWLSSRTAIYRYPTTGRRESRAMAIPDGGESSNTKFGFTGKKQVGRRPKETTMWMSTSNTLKNGNKDLSVTEIVHHVS